MDPRRGPSDGPRWDVWAGVEAEGRYRGLRSLFFARVPAGLHAGALAMRPERHAYFNPSCWDEDQAAVETLVRDLLDRGWAVTLSLRPDQFRLVPPPLWEACHLQAVLDVPDLAALPLKPTDSIRLDSRLFVNHTVQFGHLDRCVPGDYGGDRPIESFASPGGPV